MLRLTVFFSSCYLLYSFKQCKGYNVLIFGVDAFWYTLKLLFKLFSVRLFSFDRQYRFAVAARLRVFMGADVVFLIYQIWRYKQCEKLALFKRFSNVFVKFLARHKVFVIPYGNVSAKWVFMYEPHKFIRKLPVFFSVTQKDVRVKCTAYPLCHFVIHKHGMKKFL